MTLTKAILDKLTHEVATPISNSWYHTYINRLLELDLSNRRSSRKLP
ncbi:hypothetical protein ALT721_940037 [Alteromonas alvinellae]